jgi:hypothetical protein
MKDELIEKINKKAESYIGSIITTSLLREINYEIKRLQNEERIKGEEITEKAIVIGHCNLEECLEELRNDQVYPEKDADLNREISILRYDPSRAFLFFYKKES